MASWVLRGVLRSQWAYPLYIPLTWPDITIHFCHSQHQHHYYYHSISENCRKSHILLSVESLTQKLNSNCVSSRFVFCLGGWRSWFIWLYERNIFSFIKFEKPLSWAWRYLFEYTENTGREQTERSVKPADIIISYLPYQVVTPVDQSFLSKLESLIWKFHRFCWRLFKLNFTQFCGLRLCQNVVGRGNEVSIYRYF